MQSIVSLTEVLVNRDSISYETSSSKDGKVESS